MHKKCMIDVTYWKRDHQKYLWKSKDLSLNIYTRVTLSQLIFKIHYECIHQSGINQSCLCHVTFDAWMKTTPFIQITYTPLIMNVIVIHNLANGKYLKENKQVKVAFQMIAAFPAFGLPPTLSIQSITKQFLLMVIPAYNWVLISELMVLWYFDLTVMAVFTYNTDELSTWKN